MIVNEDKLTVIATSVNSNEKKKKELRDLGIKVIEVPEKKNKVDLKELMKALGNEGIDSILIEGGGTLNFSALEEKIVDKVFFYVAPKILGGEKSKSCIAGTGFSELEEAPNLKDVSYRKIGEDLVVEGYIRNS